MSIWSRLIRRGNPDENGVFAGGDNGLQQGDAVARYAVIDVEVGLKDLKIHDIGALRDDGATFHMASKERLFKFIKGVNYVCGHNIIHHDAKYLFGKKGARVYSLLVVAFIIVGSTLKVDLVWSLADFFNGLMVIPNALALLALSGAVAAVCRKYSAGKKRRDS